MRTIFKGLDFKDYEFLSEEEMELISGGNESLDPPCKPDGASCGNEGGNWTCSVQRAGTGPKECCCGNSQYNWRCVE
jgi:hypothetical protein